MTYHPTIGLEVHVELLTERKMFCDCRNDETELQANKNVCPICLGHPGTLPRANKKAIDYVIKTGRALNCSINKESKFDRKNYFYPDLPKAYQISQYDQPLCVNGWLKLPFSKHTIRIKRIHLEEDTARLSHAADGKHSLVDFNRAGVPLMELVTEPDFHSASDVVEFAQEFQLMLRYLGVSDGDMEKGHLRLEANISVAPKESETLGTKVEVKNLNSFKVLEKSISFEIERQSKVYEEGGLITQETRGWDEERGGTVSQRSKEEAHDYRYFPEPDLPPLHISDEDIRIIEESIAELPQERRERLSKEYGLSEKQSHELAKDIFYTDFFEEAVSEARALDKNVDPQKVYNYLFSDVRGIELDIALSLDDSHLTPQKLADIVVRVGRGEISSRVAKDILSVMFQEDISVEGYIKEHNLGQISDRDTLRDIAADVIKEHPDAVAQFHKGKENAIQFLLGQVMAKTKGAADPKESKDVLLGLLKKI